MKKLLILALLCSGCATGYKQANTGGTIVGFEETKITNSKYRVKYQGGNDTTPQIYQYFLRRGAELTKAQGYPRFNVVEGHESNLERGIGSYIGRVNLPFYEGTIVMTNSPATENSFEVTEVLGGVK